MENNIQITSATQKMIHDFYGRMPIKTVRALAMVKDDKVLGIGGIYLENDHIIFFSDLTDEARKNKFSLLKATYRILNSINSSLPVYSICDTSIKNADKLLKHIGFYQIDERIYQWDQ